MNNKIKSAASLASICKKLRAKRKRIVFTNGCFDILHLGHVTYLDRAKRLGDILVVGLNSDRSVRAIKGPHRPINCQKNRSAVLAALGCVDYVTIFNEETPEKLIRRLCPDILVKGGDWQASKIVGADFVTGCGGKVVRIPFVKGHSTTAMIRAMGGK